VARALTSLLGRRRRLRPLQGSQPWLRRRSARTGVPRNQTPLPSDSGAADRCGASRWSCRRLRSLVPMVQTWKILWHDGDRRPSRGAEPPARNRRRMPMRLVLKAVAVVLPVCRCRRPLISVWLPVMRRAPALVPTSRPARSGAGQQRNHGQLPTSAASAAPHRPTPRTPAYADSEIRRGHSGR
jgi:hypothetical protein